MTPEPIFRRIVAAVDHSPMSEAVVSAAARVRDGVGGALSLVHVVALSDLEGYGIVTGRRPDDTAEQAAGWLAGVAAAFGPADPAVLVHDPAVGYPALAEVDRPTEAAAGYPPALVCQWVEATACDLLVVGTHRGIVERAMLGSFADYVARHAPCPVLFVPPRTGG